MMFYVSSQDCFTNIKTVILERMVEKTRGPGENILEGMVEKTRGPWENHKTWQVNLQTLGFAKIGFHPRQREVPQFLFTL